MPLRGHAFLALWNDRSPARSDYDVWHSREHVPERLTVPGISRAVRYASGVGTLPRYFTLYTLDDLSALSHPDYVQLLHHPTPWSRSMRPDFARFLRLPCTLVSSAGGGVGGWCVTCLVSSVPNPADLANLVEQLIGYSSVTAVLYGSYAAEAGDVPFAIATDGGDAPEGVLVIEGFDHEPLRAGVQTILARFAGRIPTSDVTSYELAFALDATAIASIRPYPQPADATRFDGEPSAGG